jgi:hypothetical protein
MNKVDEEEKVEHALSAVRQELSQSTKEGRAIGLELWKYDRGYWIWAEEYAFGESKAAGSRPASKSGVSGKQAPESGTSKRPGLLKRGSSVAEAWKSVSFRR